MIQIDRGQARAAASSPSLCGADRPVRPADARAERRNAVLGARHRRDAAPAVVHVAGPPRAQGLPQLLGLGPREESRRRCWRPPASPCSELIEEFCGGMVGRPHLQGLSAGRRLRRHPSGLDGRAFRSISARWRNTAASSAPHAVVILSDQDDMKAVAPQPDEVLRGRKLRPVHPLPRRHREGRQADGTSGPWDARPAERTVGADARRFDLRPRAGGAQSAVVSVLKILPGGADESRSRELVSFRDEFFLPPFSPLPPPFLLPPSLPLFFFPSPSFFSLLFSSFPFPPLEHRPPP